MTHIGELAKLTARRVRTLRLWTALGSLYVGRKAGTKCTARKRRHVFPSSGAEKPLACPWRGSVDSVNLQFENLDLRDSNLPFFRERAFNAYAPIQNAEGVQWHETFTEYDGYNRSAELRRD